MTRLADAPPTLCCPRCNGPMFRQAADELDYLCLLCGEYRFLVRPTTKIAPLPPETFNRRRGRPGRYGY
jgi:hypothetical protein